MATKMTETIQNLKAVKAEKTNELNQLEAEIDRANKRLINDLTDHVYHFFESEITPGIVLAVYDKSIEFNQKRPGTNWTNTVLNIRFDYNYDEPGTINFIGASICTRSLNTDSHDEIMELVKAGRLAKIFDEYRCELIDRWNESTHRSDYVLTMLRRDAHKLRKELNQINEDIDTMTAQHLLNLAEGDGLKLDGVDFKLNGQTVVDNVRLVKFTRKPKKFVLVQADEKTFTVKLSSFTKWLKGIPIEKVLNGGFTGVKMPGFSPAGEHLANGRV